MIALVGFMGSGKTSVGRLLAARLGRSFVDTDRIVATRADRSIPEIFTTDGEAHFRLLERDAVLNALEDLDSIVALGGGAVTDPEVRSRLKDVTTVYLEVAPEEVLRRVGTGETRPLLDRSDPERLLAERRPLYESVANVTIDTTERTVYEVVDEIVASIDEARSGATTERRIKVDLGSRSYEVVVGRDLRIDSRPSGTGDAEYAFIVTHPNLTAMTDPLRGSLEDLGFKVKVLLVPEGEQGKSLEVTGALYAALTDGGAHRHDLVLTFGGGVVSDVGGFVASTYARGMALVHVPTTLLGQVDAAVGGKTGVNLPQGKNLVGTIHQPAGVLCDVELLRTCPEEEIRSGLAEVIKYGFIADPDLLELVSARIRDILRCDPGVLTEIVSRCVSIKAGIVAADERESDERAFLNYGHTFAHAIEAASGFEGIRHGEAVAIGMMAAAFTARELGRIDDDVVSLHRTTLKGAGLPTGAVLDLAVLETAWKKDKKYKHGTRFVLLMDLGKPEAGLEVPVPVLETVIAKLAEEEGAS